MTRYDSLKETPTMPPSDLQWPAEYGASNALNSSLARLQREPTLWKDLSRADCVKQYNDAVYTRYRTLVLSASSSLIALCPDSYLKAYNGTIHPPETPFLTLDKVIAAPKNVTFLSPTQAREWVTNRSLSADVSPTRTLERRRAPLVRPTDTFNPMPGRDLCYHYWSDDDRWMPDTLIYRVPQYPLQYCLAEPVKTQRMCQVVYSPRVLFILSVFLTFLFTIVSIALYLRCAREGLYSREDASEYFRHKKCRPRWPEKFYGKHGGGSRSFHHRRMPWHLFFFSTVVFTYVFVLWGVGGIGGYYPSGPGVQALTLNKALHIVFEVQFYFEDVDVRKRFFRVTPDVDYQDAGKKSWVQKKLRKIGEFLESRETYLKLSLAMRSFLIHTVYELIFISQLMGAAPLEEAAGTLTGSKPLAFITLGVPGFNERSVDLIAGFIIFNWLVFVGLPSALLDAIFYATAGRPVDEKEHVMAPSTMLFSIGREWMFGAETKMLRRPATTLTITSEDVAAYEDRRAREALVAAQQARRAAAVAAAQAQAQQQQQEADMEGVDRVLQEREREGEIRRARDERIGVGRRR
ncbi:hypothetical protein NCS55_00159500 [Fusarium keratoplasticum]|nr:hypothetical protein NCS55_00159500 [Fusarium keratoplasticum]